jgi:hypothetical protein
MAGGNSPRRKGYCFERECVNDARSMNLACSRVPLSGAGEEKGDIRLVTGFGDTLKGEAKRRKKLADWIVNALGDHDFLIMREDRGETYVLIRSKLFWELCQ